MQKIYNKKKAFAVFLLGQIATTGAWCTNINVPTNPYIVNADDNTGLQLQAAANGGSLLINNNATISNPGNSAIVSNALGVASTYTITNNGTVSRNTAGIVMDFTDLWSGLIGGTGSLTIINNGKITANSAADNAIAMPGGLATRIIHLNFTNSVQPNLVGNDLSN